jgi:putative Mg2+ transporter-C (MgtC) family protein
MLNQVELISRLLLAAIPGRVIGFERERLYWAEALRLTNVAGNGGAAAATFEPT